MIAIRGLIVFVVTLNRRGRLKFLSDGLFYLIML